MEKYKLSVLTVSRNKENVERVISTLVNSKRVNPSDIEFILSWNGGDEYKSIDFSGLGSGKVHIDRPYNFARNNNAIAELATGKLLLLLNDDVILDPYSLAHALELIESEAVGIVGGNLRYQTGKLQHAGVFFDPDSNKPFHRFKGTIEWDDESVQHESVVPAVTGALMLMRREEFLALKFDERFKVAGEDIVLNCSYRNKFNRKIVYSFKVSGVHIENDTRKKTGEKTTPEKDLQLIKQAIKSVRPYDKLKVRIITEKPGWIMHRKAEEISKKSTTLDVVINEDMPDADIHYYINYGFFNKRPSSGLVVGNFTHFDKDALGNKFQTTAEVMDYCFSVSEKTTEELVNFGIPKSKITTILVGADKRFKPKLTLGLVGRPYKGGRKGEHLVQQLSENTELMKKVDLVALNDEWNVKTVKFEDNATFYNMVDFLLVPSLIEGGPVPFMEALACGTVSIAPEIGVIPEFTHITYEKGNIDSLTAVINELADEHVCRKQYFAKEMAMLDWENWAFKHEIAFHELILKKDGVTL